MRLLILTQAVDQNDPVLGFFHAWIAQFAARSEKVTVICLREGEHSLPSNVTVLSLGKEHGPSRLKYITRFYRYIWSMRREYDAVFAHMNSEYVVLGGLLWRIWGKRIALWRNHKMSSRIMRVAAQFTNAICYTSPAAYGADHPKSVQMPIGIDTDRFKPAGTPPAESVLFLGRFDLVKKPDIFLEALALLEQEGVRVAADIYGDPSPGWETYANDLKTRYEHLAGVRFYPGVRNDETPAIYAAHNIYVNVTPSGSFDKTIGEAMAAGCVAIVANEAVQGVVPPDHLVDANSPRSVADGIKKALSLSRDERAALVQKQRMYIVQEHSLSLLVDRVLGILRA